MDDSAHEHAARRAPRRAPIFALLSANAVSLTGNALANVAVPWFVLQTTGSFAKTGLAFAATGLGNVLSGFLGGPAVDRLGFRRCSVLADLGSGAAVALVPLLYATVGLSFWALLALVFVGALVDMPGNAARQSMVPRLAEMAETSKEGANSATQAVRQLSLFAGPPLAGVLVAWIGAVSVLWLNAASFAVSAALVALAVPAVRKASRPSSGGPARSGLGGYVAELKEGLGFLRRDRPVFAIVYAAVAFNFFFTPLLTVVAAAYARSVFGTPTSLGLMLGAFGGGTLLGSVLFGFAGRRWPRRAVLTLGIVAVSLPVWALVFTPPLAASVAILAVSGFANGPINPVIFTLVQERTPEELLGRVMSALFALSLAAVPLGAALSGWLLEVLGLRPVLSLIAGGVLVVALALAFSPAMREVDGTAEDPNPRKGDR